MITYAIAFVGTLTIEVPFVGLEKLFLGSKFYYNTYVTVGLKFHHMNRTQIVELI